MTEVRPSDGLLINSMLLPGPQALVEEIRSAVAPTPIQILETLPPVLVERLAAAGYRLCGDAKDVPEIQEVRHYLLAEAFIPDECAVAPCDFDEGSLRERFHGGRTSLARKVGA